MDWKTFAGSYYEEFACLNAFRAKSDGIDLTRKDSLAEYFRAHLERGIASLNDIHEIKDLTDTELATKSRNQGPA